MAPPRKERAPPAAADSLEWPPGFRFEEWGPSRAIRVDKERKQGPERGQIYGRRLLVSTTTKLEPVTSPSWCNASLFQCLLGAPLINQSLPLSATIIP